MSAVTDPHPHRRTWAIAGPAILANSSAPLVGLVDTWAVGHLPGAVHLAAVGLGSVIFSYLLWAFGFLRMGTTGLVAQAWGREDHAALDRVVLRSAALALGLGLALLALQAPILELSLRALAPPENVAGITIEYYRIRIASAPAALLVYATAGVLFGLGRTRAVLVQQLVLNIVNGVLNVTFVVGLDMGVPGVAWGTLIATWLAAGVSVWMLVRIRGGHALLAAARADGAWRLSRFGALLSVNGFIFVRTVFLMTALALIMRVAGQLGPVEMAASHVATQYMLLMSLGLDGFAHAAEALAGAAWGHGRRAVFRRWVRITTLWALVASLAYALLFWLGGDAITRLLTDLDNVRAAVDRIMPLIIALPVVAVWCYQFDGIYIGATAAAAMMVTMALAFGVYLLVLDPMASRWGVAGLWGAVLVFMAARGLAQAAWYPRLAQRLPDR